MLIYIKGHLIAIISLIIAVCSAIIAIKTHYQSKKDAYHNVATFLMEQKNEFISEYAAICEMAESEEKKYLLSELAATYCNAFESACSLYLEKAINRKLFENVFKDEIASICKGDGIANLIDINDPDNPDYYKQIKLAHEKIEARRTKNIDGGRYGYRNYN